MELSRSFIRAYELIKKKNKGSTNHTKEVDYRYLFVLWTTANLVIKNFGLGQLNDQGTINFRSKILIPTWIRGVLHYP